MVHSRLRSIEGRLCVAALALLTAAPAAAEEFVRIVTWNVLKCRSVAEVDARGDDFRQAFEVLRPDILLLQEVNSVAVVRQILQRAGEAPDKWSVRCTEFSPGDGDTWDDLEVAIASRIPITHAVEYDPEPDNNERGLIERRLRVADKLPIAPVGTKRGFLWAQIADLKLTVVNTHLKSSGGKRGQEDADNARQREFVAAAMAQCVLDDLQTFPGYAVLVGGDLNVGVADATKNGRDLSSECLELDCGEADRYDETHAILSGGLVGLQMRSLFDYWSMYEGNTYPGFPGTPIDNLYAAGGGADRFLGAQIVIHPDANNAELTFGSDHRPVLAILRRE
jgi:endonuclease/exonuclease/phosphatase family metal-dependent hydrolase